MKTKIYRRIISMIRAQGSVFAVLLDPDKVDIKRIPRMVSEAEHSGVDLFLVGGSLLLSSNFDRVMEELKRNARIPVLIFPGSSMQLSRFADAILFLSLISGRNPQWLIGEQVRSAPIIKSFGLEAIPTGYILVDSGRQTSVSFISNTTPIPQDKPDILCAHGLAGQYLGMRLLYLDAGSGANQPVEPEMIKSLRKYVELPIFVGGGIRTPKSARMLVEAGANGIVIGNVLEKYWDVTILRKFAESIHRS